MRVAFLALLLSVAGRAQTDPPSGYVLKCAGQWTATRNGQDRPLKPGVVVNPGDKLHSNPPDAILSLVLYDGTYLKCPASDKCKQPIQIPPRAQAQGTLSAFLDRLTNKHLPPVAFVTSRAAGSPSAPVELHDAVLAGGGAELDLSAVLSATPAVSIPLYLEPLDAPAGCDATLFKLPAGQREVDAPLPARCNGLYQLSGTGESMEGTYPATMLLVSPGERADAERRFRDAVAAAAQWHGAGEDEKRTFLRLTLSAIRQSLGPSR